jgi:hypothetical protein
MIRIAKAHLLRILRVTLGWRAAILRATLLVVLLS